VLRPGHRAMCMFHVAARSIMCWASRRALCVNSCELRASSHMGEWWLKSPSQMSPGVGVPACLCTISVVSR
jgi:hypothetical protein